MDYNINKKSWIKEIKQIVSHARYATFTSVNTEMLRAYYEIGKRIVEEEQNGI